jgi:ketosteroid isomerase-like protein
MADQDVEVVRRIYAAWEAGEIGHEHLAEEVEWVNPPDALEPGVRQGIEAFTDAITQVFDVWPEFEIRPERLEEVDDRILMIGHQHARLRGVPVSQPQAHVWTVRDGKVLRFCWFTRGEHALEALGLDG